MNGERHHRAQGSNPRRPKFFQAFSHNCMMISIPWFTYMRFHMSVYSLVWLFSVNNYLFCIFSYQIIFLSHIQMNKLPELQMRVRNINFKVAKHSFGSLWVYFIYQIIASSQAETLKNILMKDFGWLVKCDVFIVSMATLTIKYSLKISLLLSLHKILSLDFAINLHTAYFNYSLPFETYLTKF